MPLAPATTWTNDRLNPLFAGNGETGVKLVQGVYVKGQLLGEVTATPGTYKAYANGNADGSETARLILAYACTVDANGVITIGEHGSTRTSAPAIVGGIFKTSDLVGLDAAALVDLGGRLLQGTVANGVVLIPLA